MIYHWAPPILGTLATAIVGIFVRRNERRRQEDEEKRRKEEETSQKFRADMKSRIDTIRKQNGWFIRKFIELSTQHNLKHEDAHINIDDYPNGYKEGGD